MISTQTVTIPSTVIPLKATSALMSRPSLSRQTSTIESLNALYNRAARAFLHRDVLLTHTLLDSAFKILQPPSFNPADPQCPIRRKWDILRITFETTIYSSPPSTELPADLQTLTTQTPADLVNSFASRSLQLYSPLISAGPKPDIAYMPPTVLVTLVLSSIKLDCADVGRVLVEQWLARRGQAEGMAPDEEGYEKVMETYCLRTLPKLELWDYAEEFLNYEGELSEETRQAFKTTLTNLHKEWITAQRRLTELIPLLPPPSAAASDSTTPTRAPSPSPSATSSSSSLSTTSTQTAVPRTPRATSFHPLNALSNGVVPSSKSTTSRSSSSSDRTVRRVSRTRHLPNHGIHRTPTASPIVPLPTNYPRAESHSRGGAVSTRQQPSTYTLIKASLAQYVSASTPKLASYILLFVIFPLVSLMVRIRRRKGLSGSLELGPGAAVRRRLKATSSGGMGVLQNAITEIVRAVVDTVRMGGSGLV